MVGSIKKIDIAKHAVEEELLGLYGIDTKDVRSSAIEVMNKMNEEIARLRQPPLSRRDIVNNFIISHPRWGDKEKKLFKHLAKTDKVIKYAILIKDLNIGKKLSSSSQQMSALRSLIRVVGQKIIKAGVSHTFQLQNVKTTGYHLVITDSRLK